MNNNFLFQNAKKTFLTLNENHILKTWLNKAIVSIYLDAFVAAILISKDEQLIIRSKPDEGVGLDENKKFRSIEVMRIEVANFKSNQRLPENTHTKINDKIQDIQILRSGLLFSEPEIVEGENLKDIQLPSRGREYRYMLLNPFKGEPITQKNKVNLIDIGIVIKLSGGGVILIHTDGVKYGIKLKRDEEVEDFLTNGVLVDLDSYDE